MGYKNIKKVLSLMTVLAICSANSIGVSAANTTTVTEAGDRAEATVSLNMTSDKPDNNEGGGGGSGDTDPTPAPNTDLFSATVPRQLPAEINIDTGAVTVADNIKIINNVENKGIQVTSVDVTANNGWTITDYDTDFNTIEADTKTFGMSLRGDKVETDGSIELSDDAWKIAKDTDIDIAMHIKVGTFTAIPDNANNIATVGFILGWSGDDESTTNKEIEDDDTVKTITFKVEGPGYLFTNTGNKTVSLEKRTSSAGTVIYPAVEVSDMAYELKGWYKGSEEITDLSKAFTADTEVTALIGLKDASSEDYFEVDESGQLVALTSAYTAVADTLTDIVVPSTVNGVAVTSIGTAFKSNSNVESIIIPEGVTSVSEGAFSACKSLKEVQLPATLNSLSTSCFYDDSSLTTVDIKGNITTIPEQAFRSCSKLATDSIDLSKVKVFEKDAFSSAFSSNGDEEITLDLSSATEIGKGAFSSIAYLKSVKLGVVNTIAEQAFWGCTKLENIDLRYTTRIGYETFVNCSSLTSVNISSASSLGTGAFRGCSKLSSVKFKDGVELNNNVFESCSSLKSITAGVLNIAGSTPFGSYLTDITVDGLTFESDSWKPYLFSSCSNLTTININDYTDAIDGSPWGATNATVNWLKGDKTSEV